MLGAGSNDGAAYVAERLDHLGIVAGICREIGLAAWLDAQDEGSHERVRVGTSTVAMILNGLGFSNRHLYLVPQFFATKPAERLLGPGITAADLSDDCLGRALDWLYAHDPTSLFACEVAGVALCSSQGVCSRRDVLFHVGMDARRISPPGRMPWGGVAGRSTEQRRSGAESRRADPSVRRGPGGRS